MKPLQKIFNYFLLIFAVVLCGFAISSRNEDKLIEISKEYKNYNRKVRVETVVTDSTKYRYKWTVALCTYIDKETMGYYHKTDSLFLSLPVNSPHGNKLYKLYVKDENSYSKLDTIQPKGQTIVKETWTTKEVSRKELYNYPNAILNRNDFRWYRPDKISELFIMYKEKESELNDKGWIYGIVNIENGSSPKVLSHGKISNCISCHHQTKYDRLFGPQ